jgi:hypothetical protein
MLSIETRQKGPKNKSTSSPFLFGLREKSMKVEDAHRNGWEEAGVLCIIVLRVWDGLEPFPCAPSAWSVKHKCVWITRRSCLWPCVFHLKNYQRDSDVILMFMALAVRCQADEILMHIGQFYGLLYTKLKFY